MHADNIYIVVKFTSKDPQSISRLLEKEIFSILCMMFLRTSSDAYGNCLMDGNILNDEDKNYHSNQQNVSSNSFLCTRALKQNIIID